MHDRQALTELRRRNATMATAKSKAKTKSKTKTKAKSKTSSKAKSKPKTKSKAKTASKPAAKSKAKSASKPAKKKSAAKPKSQVKIDRKPASSRKPIQHKNKMLQKNFLMQLASHIRDSIVPSIEAGKGREVVGESTTGDTTFKLDALAEKALLTYLRDKKAPVAYYSEDQGYTTFTSGQPQNLLVIDPIDGTRAAKSGFESCVISIATTRTIERPRFSDIDNGCVMEIMSGRAMYAERGGGARVYVNGQPRKPRLSDNTNLESMVWSMTVTGRPTELTFPTAAKLIDLSSLKGGFFACNSTSFSLSRLLTNQLDACVDIANRYYRDITPVVKDYFINAGRGAVMGIAPYDCAAAVLIAEEAGAVVTDAYGKSFDNVLLLDTAVSNLRSMVAAANPELHEKLLIYFDTRMRQYEKLFQRRADAQAGM